MSDVTCEEMQKHLLEMMKWFHEFCVKENLRYYAICGTMLGAARHQGFIPWDDDLDVGMPRNDYERLYSLLDGKTVNGYVLETPHSDADDYCYCFAKLYDTRTTLIENVKHKTKRGIYIDIFPLDGMGNTDSESRKRFSKVDARFKLLLAHTTSVRKGRNILKNAAVVFSQTIMNPFINDKKGTRKINEFLSEMDYDNTNYVGNSFGAWRYKEIVRREIMGKPTLYRFEDTEIYGVEKYDEYLTNVYGDWRQLPPVEKQVSHHDYVLLDINRSYLS